MRQIILKTIVISLLGFCLVLPVQAGEEKSLENRIKGWFSAVNEGDYYACLNYVSPFQLKRQRGLRRLRFSGGVEIF